MKGFFSLQNGSLWGGQLFGYQGETSGEVVFNTAMTGYPESLSDPSYYGQILVLTYPMIGNYGVPSDSVTLSNTLSRYFESSKPQIRGLVVNHYSEEFSHWNAQKSLSSWMNAYGIVGIEGVDTRAITKQLRTQGSMLGAIQFGGDDAGKSLWFNPHTEDIVKHVSCKEKKVHGHGKRRILLIDCGTKLNIIRRLLERDCTVIQVPYDYDYSLEEFDAIFISNGPGNPEHLAMTISHIRKSIADNRVVAGICLGCQLIGLALGGKVFKLKFGHRSHNQPVVQRSSGKCFVTSQNHAYAVDPCSLPKECEVTFENLNDGSCEGIRHKTKPVMAVQFHPEAFGGPEDTDFFFDEFVSLIS